MIELKNISFGYENKQLYRDLSLVANDGECTAIVGKNGSGKSTLIKIMCGVIKPDAGEILLQGEPLWVKHGLFGKQKVRKDHASLIGYVMQKPELQLFAESVAKDVAFGPENIGMSKEEVDASVKKWLEYFGIEAVAEKSPFKISGGQQRMAAIAGVMAMETPNVCFDEPCASLDSESVEKLHQLIADLKSAGKAVILVSHDASEVELLADKVVRLGD
ncbi:MAG: ABC transporter ATP-binding protein [Phoenicibacter congonensis]|uniref:ABC transporter ATP-binding protein n=1 Tax=Phoenicibacter congonensis TaxID=1944646 RepID=A0AA43U9J1_9ACTN|nr:ABC transporter ATP-binding protein [Phoenicibacter congonensis]